MNSLAKLQSNAISDEGERTTQSLPKKQELLSMPVREAQDQHQQQERGADGKNCRPQRERDRKTMRRKTRREKK